MMLAVIILFWFTVFCEAQTLTYWTQNGTYCERYNYQKEQVKKMLEAKQAQQEFYENLLATFSFTIMNSKQIFEEHEKREFFTILSGIKGSILNPDEIQDIYHWCRMLAEYYHQLIKLTPNIYKEIQYKNISTLGPLENIFSMMVEEGAKDAWKIIKTKTETGKCQAYDQLLHQVTTTIAQSYIEKSYNSTLCDVSNEKAMDKWYQVFYLLNPDYQHFVYTGKYNHEFPIYQFFKVCKGFRMNIYDGYFMKVSDNYPIVQTLYKALDSPLTDTEKGSIREMAKVLERNLTHESGLIERQELLSIEFTKLIDQNYGLFETFSRINLINRDGTFYDLLMWICQRPILERAYIFADFPDT